MGDANHNNKCNNSNNIPDFFQRSGKRTRTQANDDDNSLSITEGNQTPTPSGSELTSDGISPGGSNSSIPLLHLNDAEISRENSVDTMVRPSQIDKDKERLAFKLDKLNDKCGRYESHVSFLKKCLENGVTPNGLRVYVEPSIGNRDDEFLKMWHEHLNDFSRTLTNSVIEYSEKTIINTKNEIKNTTEQLKALVSTPAYNDIQNTLKRNNNVRNNELISRKNRKFYRLKYGERDREDRNQAQRRHTNAIMILSNRGHRGMGRQNRSNDERNHLNDNRINDHRNNRNDRNKTRRQLTKRGVRKKNRTG